MRRIGSPECRLEPNKSRGEDSKGNGKEGRVSASVHAEIVVDESAVEFVGGLMDAGQSAARTCGCGF